MYGRTLLEIWCGKNKIWQRLRHIIPWKAQRPKLLQVFSPRWRTEWTLRQLKGSQQGTVSLLHDGPQRSTSVFCFNMKALLEWSSRYASFFVWKPYVSVVPAKRSSTKTVEATHSIKTRTYILTPGLYRAPGKKTFSHSHSRFEWLWYSQLCCRNHCQKL